MRGLGLADVELSQVHYRAPFGSDWTAPTGPLSNVAALIREDAERLGVTYLLVDSYSVGTWFDEQEKPSGMSDGRWSWT